MTVRVAPLTGEALGDAMGDLARLRVTVFREWPYLYDGTPESEREYLATFTAAQDAIIVAALDGDEIVGVATGSPLGEHTAEFIPLFEAHGHEPSHIFYCGESVLLPAYRGQGIGHAFFDHREAFARRLVRADGGRYTHAAGRLPPSRSVLAPARLRARQRARRQLCMARDRPHRGDGKADAVLDAAARRVTPT